MNGQKDHDRELIKGFQFEIEEAIAHSRREEAARERLKLAAPPAARQRRDAVVTDMAARAQLLKDAISVHAAKQREKQARKNASAGSLGPTPERIAKERADEAIEERAPPIKDESTRITTRAHTTVAPVDKYGGLWPAEIERGARDIRNIFLIAATGAQKVTGSYDGAPSGVGGARHGGVLDYIRDHQAMAELILQKFPNCKKEIERFLTQTVIDQSGSLISWEQHGAEHSPWKEAAAKKGLGYGLFLKTLQVLVPFLEQERAKGWGASIARQPESAARAISVELKARAQIMREQAARREAEDERRRYLTKGGR